jgi:hypothetical protein
MFRSTPELHSSFGFVTVLFNSCHKFAATVVSMATKAATAAKAGTAARTSTPWGPATVVEEARVAQRAGGKRFASVFQLLETRSGELLIRIAYTTDGVVRRGPVTLRARDAERLRTALGKQPKLGQAVGLKDGDA